MTRLWQALGDDVDLVNGFKISRSDPWHRIVIGRLYHHTVKLLFGLKVRDVDCDFRLLRRSIFEQVTLEMCKSTGNTGKREAFFTVTMQQAFITKVSQAATEAIGKSRSDMAASWLKLRAPQSAARTVLGPPPG